MEDALLTTIVSMKTITFLLPFRLFLHSKINLLSFFLSVLTQQLNLFPINLLFVNGNF